MSKKQMTDQQFALRAIGGAQRLLEGHLQPWLPNKRMVDKSVEVLERPDLLVAVSRLEQTPLFGVGK